MALAAIQDILDGWPGWTPQFELAYGDELSGEGSGRTRVVGLRDPLWQLSATTTVLRPSQHRYWKARLASLENGKQLFYGYDLAGKYPILYPNGTWPTGGSFDGVSAAIHTLGANNKSVRIDGLPAAYKVSVGDYLQFTIDATGAAVVHQVMEAATADGGGLTPSFFEVRPHLWPGLAPGDVVAVKRPACTMMVLPGSIEASADPNSGFGIVGFRALQVYDA